MVSKIKSVAYQFFPGANLKLLIALVCDSASNMRSTFKFIMEEFPTIPRLVAFGCFNHKLNWIFKDVKDIPWVSRMVAQAKRIVHVFKRHTRTAAAFVQHLSQARKP